MPITRRDGKWYWGSEGPFDSREKAEEVEQAAHARGYQEDTMGMVTGTTAGGATMKINKEGEGADSSGAPTVFTVATSGFSVTHNERDKKKEDQKRKHKPTKQAGLPRTEAFLSDGTPTLKSLDLFLEKGYAPSDNLENKNRMNNPYRLDHRKVRKGNMDANRIPSSEDPSHGLQEIPKSQLVEPKKKNPDLKQEDEHKIAQQKDMEERAKKWEDERKKVRGDDPNGPPLEAGAAAASDLHMMEKAFSGGYYPDALVRGGDKDKVDSDEEEKEPEEDKWLKHCQKDYPLIYKALFDWDDYVP